MLLVCLFVDCCLGLVCGVVVRVIRVLCVLLSGMSVIACCGLLCFVACVAFVVCLRCLFVCLLFAIWVCGLCLCGCCVLVFKWLALGWVCCVLLFVMCCLSCIVLFVCLGALKCCVAGEFLCDSLFMPCCCC